MMAQGAFASQRNLPRPPAPTPGTTTARPTGIAGIFAAASDTLPPAANNTMDNHHGSRPTPSAQGGSKRKAESQDNERLSKRLSLLNIEHNGSKLYVPVETPLSNNPLPSATKQRPPNSSPPSSDPASSSMEVDDSKHKVYIYNIDDELASDSDSDDGKLVFLPDIEKHLRETRIPPGVLANSDGELAGMQVVLYTEPKSLTVPEEKDGVRKAILETRRRLREEQKQEQSGGTADVANGHNDDHVAVDSISARGSQTLGDAGHTHLDSMEID